MYGPDDSFDWSDDDEDTLLREKRKREKGTTPIDTIISRVFPFDVQAAALAVSQKEGTLYYHKKVEDIISRWERAALGPHWLHALITSHLRGPEKERGRYKEQQDAIQAFMSFWQPYSSKWEPVVFNWHIRSKCGVSGTIDGVFRDEKGKYLLCLWRYAKGLFSRGFNGKMALAPLSEFAHCNYSEYSVRLCLCRKILEEYNIRTKMMKIIVVTPSGEVKESWPSVALRNAVDDLWERLSIQGVDSVFPAS